MVIPFPYIEKTKTLNLIFSETTHRNWKKIQGCFFSLVSLISYKNIGGGRDRKNELKNFTLINYVPLRNLNINKQGYLFAVSCMYLEAVVKE